MTEPTIYLFWIFFIIVIYTYFGYGVLLFMMVKIKSLFVKRTSTRIDKLLDVTLIVAAYNEEDHIKSKIENTLKLDYPRDKIQFIIASDGSDDRTSSIISEYPEIEHMHRPERQGKIMAIDRAMGQVKGEIVIFSDANTLLNKESIKMIIRRFVDEKVGVVSGEKRILNKETDEATAAGEGFYWKYESTLKKWDDALYSVMGAAGELFAIRAELYESIPRDTLIEDFYLSFKILEKGYKIAYEPNAYALEAPSVSVKEELKRKIRIAAGGIQSTMRLKELLNPFKYGVITFQYVSHRVLRWTLAPLALPILFITNLFLWEHGMTYKILLGLQVLFYLLALIGFLMENRRIRLKFLFIPYYFCMMNYAIYIGFLRYIMGTQTVLWEKSERRTT